MAYNVRDAVETFEGGGGSYLLERGSQKGGFVRTPSGYGPALVVVRILVHWYRQHTLCVKWGRNTSSFFTVANGVRQGGRPILSPFLFTLYIYSSVIN